MELMKLNCSTLRTRERRKNATRDGRLRGGRWKEEAKPEVWLWRKTAHEGEFWNEMLYAR